MPISTSASLNWLKAVSHFLNMVTNDACAWTNKSDETNGPLWTLIIEIGSLSNSIVGKQDDFPKQLWNIWKQFVLIKLTVLIDLISFSEVAVMNSNCFFANSLCKSGYFRLWYRVSSGLAPFFTGNIKESAELASCLFASLWNGLLSILCIYICHSFCQLKTMLIFQRRHKFGRFQNCAKGKGDPEIIAKCDQSYTFSLNLSIIPAFHFSVFENADAVPRSELALLALF